MSKGKKLSPEEIKEKLKDIRSGKMKIVPADRDNVLLLSPYIMKVLEALGHPEAWVSDLSTVWDFSPGDTKGDSEFIARASVKLGFTINNKDYIIDLAQRLKMMDQDV